MKLSTYPWEYELEVVDRTMKAISGISDPEELVDVYWSNIGDLLTIQDYMSVSRRQVERPFYVVTRSSRFTEHPNPWTQRERLPVFSGGLVSELVYANKPAIIEDLPARLRDDDPAHFYLDGFRALIGLPQYDGGEALNMTFLLLPKGDEVERDMVPMLHWQAGLFGRGTTNLVLRNQLTAASRDLLHRRHEAGGELAVPRDNGPRRRRRGERTGFATHRLPGDSAPRRFGRASAA